jgi:hypothetical protein
MTCAACVVPKIAKKPIRPSRSLALPQLRTPTIIKHPIFVPVVKPVIKPLHVPVLVPRLMQFGSLLRTLGHLVNPLAPTKPIPLSARIAALKKDGVSQRSKARQRSSSEEHENGENSSGIHLNIYKFN